MKKILDKTGYEATLFKRHWQTLSLGYLAHRMEEYNRFLAKILGFFTKILNIKNLSIPYWLGQTLVVARKKK